MAAAAARFRYAEIGPKAALWRRGVHEMGSRPLQTARRQTLRCAGSARGTVAPRADEDEWVLGLCVEPRTCRERDPGLRTPRPDIAVGEVASRIVQGSTAEAPDLRVRAGLVPQPSHAHRTQRSAALDPAREPALERRGSSALHLELVDAHDHRERERRSALLLAVQAVTRVVGQRLARNPVANRTTDAPTFQIVSQTHPPLRRGARGAGGGDPRAWGLRRRARDGAAAPKVDTSELDRRLG